MVAIVATHGAYNRQNTSSDREDSMLKNDVKDVGSNTFNVETTDSLAKKPVIKATVTLQSAKPSGLKIGESKFAALASIDSSGVLTICILNEKLCKNQINIEAINIIEKALCKKSLAFSHNSCDTDL